jgi:Ca-activated chloride channel family protein
VIKAYFKRVERRWSVGPTLLLFLMSVGWIELGTQRAPTPLADPTLVHARVTVTGPRKEPLPLLRAVNFQLWEDGREQPIASVAREDEGLSLGIIYSAGDVSGPQSAPRVLLENSGHNIEYFLMAGDTVTVPFSTDIRRVPPLTRPEGGALENLYVGLDVLKEAAYSRKALVLIGGDLAEPPQTDYIKAQAIRQGVAIYAIMSEGIPPGPAILALDEIVSLAGGEIYYAPFDAPAAVEMYALQIAQGLRNQYRVGYRPTNAARDGKWLKLRVRVNNVEDVRLQARVKSGRYALP